MDAVSGELQREGWCLTEVRTSRTQAGPVSRAGPRQSAVALDARGRGPMDAVSGELQREGWCLTEVRTSRTQAGPS